MALPLRPATAGFFIDTVTASGIALLPSALPATRSSTERSDGVRVCQRCVDHAERVQYPEIDRRGYRMATAECLQARFVLKSGPKGRVRSLSPAWRVRFFRSRWRRYLRREGIYSSQLYAWRRERAQGDLDPKTLKNRAAKRLAEQESERRIHQLEVENRKLHRQIARFELFEEIRKKAAGLLNLEYKSPEFDEND